MMLRTGEGLTEKMNESKLRMILHFFSFHKIKNSEWSIFLYFKNSILQLREHNFKWL